MTGAIGQHERFVRMLARIERTEQRSLEDYDEDCWCLFQNCWHSKDWIKSDNGVEPRYREMVEADVGDISEIRICADVANRSKHLKLERTVREETRVSNTNTIIHVGTPGTGSGEHELGIQLGDGTELNALDVARTAVTGWSDLLIESGVLR